MSQNGLSCLHPGHLAKYKHLHLLLLNILNSGGCETKAPDSKSFECCRFVFHNYTFICITTTHTTLSHCWSQAWAEGEINKQTTMRIKMIIRYTKKECCSFSMLKSYKGHINSHLDSISISYSCVEANLLRLCVTWKQQEPSHPLPWWHTMISSFTAKVWI